MTVALYPTSIAAFAVLTVAAGLLWLPSLIASRHSSRAWMAPALLAVVLAFASDLIDWRGFVALLVFAAACIAAHRVPGKSARLVAHAVVLALCAGFFLHVAPGFNNPRVIDAVLIGEGTSSYSKDPELRQRYGRRAAAGPLCSGARANRRRRATVYSVRLAICDHGWSCRHRGHGVRIRAMGSRSSRTGGRSGSGACSCSQRCQKRRRSGASSRNR